MAAGAGAAADASQVIGFCTYCLKSPGDKTVEKVYDCGRCYFATYCSAECQKADWPTHKTVCRWLADQSTGLKPRQFLGLPHPAWKVHPTGLVFSRLLETPFDSTLEDGTEKVVIDLGCGNGWSSAQLLKRGWKVIAVDFFEEQLQATRHNASNHQFLKSTPEAVAARLETVRCDVFGYQFPTNVDLVIVQNPFPYIDPVKVGTLFRRIHTSLKPERWLMGSFFEPNHIGIKTYGAWSVRDVAAHVL